MQAARWVARAAAGPRPAPRPRLVFFRRRDPAELRPSRGGVASEPRVLPRPGLPPGSPADGASSGRVPAQLTRGRPARRPPEVTSEGKRPRQGRPRSHGPSPAGVRSHRGDGGRGRGSRRSRTACPARTRRPAGVRATGRGSSGTQRPDPEHQTAGPGRGARASGDRAPLSAVRRPPRPQGTDGHTRLRAAAPGRADGRRGPRAPAMHPRPAPRPRPRPRKCGSSLPTTSPSSRARGRRREHGVRRDYKYRQARRPCRDYDSQKAPLAARAGPSGICSRRGEVIP